MSPIILTRCRLCWHITAAVFFSILTVEALILVPSYRNYERDRVTEHIRAGSAALTAALTLSLAEPIPEVANILAASRLVGIAGITGIALYDGSGGPPERVGTQLDAAAETALLGRHADHRQIGRDALVAHVPIGGVGSTFALMQIETPSLPGDLRRFLVRIAGLVALITAVATVTTMLVLRFTILHRIIDLKLAVSAAALRPHEASRFRLAASGIDELSVLASDVNLLFEEATRSIQSLRRRESEIVALNESLERRVADRTAELETAREASEGASRAKSAFLANMSHELRTPLNAIVGFGELMRDEILGPLGNARYREYASDIVASGQHLGQIINDVLDLSRVETGRVEIDDGPVDLSAVVKFAVSQLASVASARSIEIRCNGFDAPLAALGDHRRLRQIVINLLTNAVKFSSVEGRVLVDHVLDRDGSLAIRITDAGIGIAPENLSSVMAPFGQVESVLARTHQGMGLGLPLTMRLLELHGGRLEIRSSLGRGTAALAWLPPGRVVSKCKAGLSCPEGYALDTTPPGQSSIVV